MINPRELEILNILWNSEEPMTSSQIVNVGDMLSQSTVQTVLRKLLKAKLVEVTGVTYSGNVLSRTYKPSEASRDVILQKFVDDYNGFRNIISKETLVAAMLDTDGSEKERASEIANLKNMLKEYEKKN